MSVREGFPRGGPFVEVRFTIASGVEGGVGEGRRSGSLASGVGEGGSYRVVEGEAGSRSGAPGETRTRGREPPFADTRPPAPLTRSGATGALFGRDGHAGGRSSCLEHYLGKHCGS